MSENLTRCSIASSLEAVQELHGSQENDGIRAQLRERDELAMQLLHTLSQLDSECSQNNACLSKIAQIGSELKAHTIEEIPKLSQDESLCKLRLLKGVILVLYLIQILRCRRRV